MGAATPTVSLVGMASGGRPGSNWAARAIIALLVLSACRPADTTAAPEPSPPSVSATSPGPTSEPATPALEPSEPFGRATVHLRSGDRSLPVAVYVADSPELRTKGLMGREDLPDGTGMLFTYASDHTGEFWMRDTLIPLSIAFFTGSGDLIDVIDMEPCDTAICPRYGPDAPYRYALEVPKGWYAAHGVDTGWRLMLPSTASPSPGL